MLKIPIPAYPAYWQLLSDPDKYHYLYIRANISAQKAKNQRNKRLENFTETLEWIRRFCIRNDGDDWKRQLVCGICWLNEGLAINTRQLKLLIFKCKSSINGSLHKMRFTVNMGRSEAANALINTIPFLKGNLNEIRQWTVRQANQLSPGPISPAPTPNSICTQDSKTKNANQNGFEIPILNYNQPGLDEKNSSDYQDEEPSPAQQVPVVNKPLPIPNIDLVRKLSPIETDFAPKIEIEDIDLSIDKPMDSMVQTRSLYDEPIPMILNDNFW